MDGGQLHAALGHHPGGHRAVQTAADEDGRLASGAHGNAPRARLGVPVDKGVLFPHLHPDSQLRMMDVHPQMGELLQQIATHLGGNLRGLVGELLVAAFALHFKGGDLFQLVCQIPGRPLTDLLQVFPGHARPGIAHHAEHLGNPVFGQVHVGAVVLGHHINRGLAGRDRELPRALQPAADIFEEHVLEGPAVQAL